MSKEKKLIDMTLSELVEQSLAKGLVPIFQFNDKEITQPQSKQPSTQEGQEDEKEIVPEWYGGYVVEENRKNPGWMIGEVKDKNGKVWHHEFWCTNGVPNHGFYGNSYGYFLTKIRSPFWEIQSAINLVSGQAFKVGEEVKGGIIKNFDIVFEDIFPNRLRVGFEDGGGKDFMSLEKLADAGCGWEIVAYREKNTQKTIWTKENTINDGLRNDFQKPNEWTGSRTGHSFEIFSVRRTSDGVVFSVGDEVDVKGEPFGSFHITGFKLIPEYPNGLAVSVTTGGNAHSGLESCSLDIITKTSQPPTTEKEETNYKHPIIFDQANDFNREDNPVLFTTEQMNKAIKDAFKAGRTVDTFNKGSVEVYKTFVYSTVEDYLKTLTTN